MQTKGEYLVGLTFNPSNSDLVGRIKRSAADLIDLIETIPTPTAAHGPVDPEHVAQIGRLKALAVTASEEAAMWAVKAATKPERVRV